jgi:hypothetical protein
MSWGEAVRLFRQLTRDWSSAVAASLAGWDYPLSREGIILADIFDLQHSSKSKKRPKPYPRPYGTDEQKTMGRKTRPMTTVQLRKILDRQREGIE